MKLEISDEVFEMFVVAWLKQQKEWTEEALYKNEYWHPEDRLHDEEYLQGLNIMLYNHEVNYEG